MNDQIDKFREAVREELKPVHKKLDSLWDQTVKLTEEVTEIKDTLETHAASADQTNENVSKMNKRLIEVESNLGISPPPELTLPK